MHYDVTVIATPAYENIVWLRLNIIYIMASYWQAHAVIMVQYKWKFLFAKRIG